MALANESTDPHIQACNHIFGKFPSSDLHLQSLFGFFDHLPFHEAEIDVIGEGSSVRKDKISSSFKNFSMFYNSSPTSSPSSENSSGYGFQGTDYQNNDAPSLNIKLTYENCMHPSGSLLSFEKAKVPIIPQNSYNNFSLLENFNSHQSDGNFVVSMNKKIVKEKQRDDMLGWISCDATSEAEGIAAEGIGNHKRPQTGESNMKSQKKQCTSATKKSKVVNQVMPSRDPQSVAAKNRRERISERLKILQELVPNGSKVDLVTMLEKAISYVKFLQLQVKVLATDEFWPDQGGKAPELSQVKEAIDAILSSQQINKSSSSR